MTLHSLNHFLRTIALSGLLIITAATCSNDSSSPTDSNGSGGTLDTKTATVTDAGGTVTLASGASVVFPPGAVSMETEYTVRDIDPAMYFDGDDVGRMVVSVDGAVTSFDQPVELRIPLPAGMTAADSSKVFAGVIDEESGTVVTESASISMIDGNPYLVIEATHFSSRLAEWLFGPEPPASYGPLTVPYFNQGASNYCWATSLQMVTEAAGHSTTSDITDIIGSMGVDEGGITSFSFRYSPTIAGIVMARTGVKPDRKTWGYLTVNRMKDYLKAEIGLRQHPVALFNGAWEHAVVVVGYDGDTFTIHDPQSTTPSGIGYTTKTWQQIAGSMGALTNMVTLTVPKALDSSRPEVTTHIMPGAFDFIKPKQNDGDKSMFYRLDWDYTKKDGYSFKEAGTSAIDKLPGEITELRQNGDIEVYNSSRTASKTVSVWLDITAIGAPPGDGHYSANEEITLGPNTSGTVTFDTIPVEEFRWGTGDTEYFLNVKALDGGTVSDECAITFLLPPAELHIESLSPVSGPAGTEVTITGTGFGTSKDTYVVMFGVGSSLPLAAADSDIIAWTDTKIRVRVPEKASTGTVVIREKGIMTTRESNGVPFTVSDTVTYSGISIHRRIWGEYGEFATFTANWTLTAAYPDTTQVNDTYSTDYFINVRTQVPVTLSATVTGSLTMTSRETIVNWDSTRVVEVFHDLKPLDAVADPEADETSVRINGTFPYTITGTGGQYTLTMNLDRGDYYPYDRLELLPLFEYQVDRYKYSIREADYGALLSQNLNDNNVLYPVPFSWRIGVNTDWMHWTGN